MAIMQRIYLCREFGFHDYAIFLKTVLSIGKIGHANHGSINNFSKRFTM